MHITREREIHTKIDHTSEQNIIMGKITIMENICILLFIFHVSICLFQKTKMSKMILLFVVLTGTVAKPPNIKIEKSENEPESIETESSFKTSRLNPLVPVESDRVYKNVEIQRVYMKINRPDLDMERWVEKQTAINLYSQSIKDEPSDLTNNLGILNHKISVLEVYTDFPEILTSKLADPGICTVTIDFNSENAQNNLWVRFSYIFKGLPSPTDATKKINAPATLSTNMNILELAINQIDNFHRVRYSEYEALVNLKERKFTPFLSYSFFSNFDSTECTQNKKTFLEPRILFCGFHEKSYGCILEVLSLSNPAPVQIYKVLPINGKNYEQDYIYQLENDFYINKCKQTLSSDCMVRIDNNDCLSGLRGGNTQTIANYCKMKDTVELKMMDPIPSGVVLNSKLFGSKDISNPSKFATMVASFSGAKFWNKIGTINYGKTGANLMQVYPNIEDTFLDIIETNPLFLLYLLLIIPLSGIAASIGMIITKSKRRVQRKRALVRANAIKLVKVRRRVQKEI